MTDRVAMTVKTLDRMEFLVFDGSSKLRTYVSSQLQI